MIGLHGGTITILSIGVDRLIATRMLTWFVKKKPI